MFLVKGELRTLVVVVFLLMSFCGKIDWRKRKTGFKRNHGTQVILKEFTVDATIIHNK
jgi:hypothetical protein